MAGDIYFSAFLFLKYGDDELRKKKNWLENVWQILKDVFLIKTKQGKGLVSLDR